MDENKIYFFGYGASRDARKIGKILGNTPTSCIGAVIEKYALFYQNLEQTPEPVKGILKGVWSESFKAYTIHPGKGIVAGVIWEISKEELEIIKKWEFVGVWREIISVKARTFDDRIIEAVTDKAIRSDLNAGFYDGLNYPNNLNLNQNLVTDSEQINEDLYKIEKLRRLRDELLSVPQSATS